MQPENTRASALSLTLGHAYRMRTDSVWYGKWDSLEALDELVPPASFTVAIPVCMWVERERARETVRLRSQRGWQI